MWQAIAYVSSGLSLVAFLAAVAAWSFKIKSDERARLILTASESDRASLIRDALEFFHVETSGLTKEQQFKIALEQIRARAERFRWSAGVICFFAVVAAGTAAYAMTLRETPPASVIGPTADQFAEVIRLRIDDLIQSARNVNSLLDEIRAGHIDQAGPLNRVNDLNNNLTDLWLKIAGYGLGNDPYPDNIFFSGSAFSRAHFAPDYGVTTVPQSIGIPRLYARFLESSDKDARSRQRKEEVLATFVQPYSNPASFPHRDFYQRAYSHYREGSGLESDQYRGDLAQIKAWLNALLASLEKVGQLVPGRSPA